jgi:hypothetical protein
MEGLLDSDVPDTEIRSITRHLVFSVNPNCAEDHSAEFHQAVEAITRARVEAQRSAPSTLGLLSICTKSLQSILSSLPPRFRQCCFEDVDVYEALAPGLHVATADSHPEAYELLFSVYLKEGAHIFIYNIYIYIVILEL